MTQSYFLGCPQWQHSDWNTRLPPAQSPLERYSKVLNCVEGNTTFYATPSQEQCRQWRSQVPEDFRFLFKFPRLITHDRLLSGAGLEVSDFLEILAPLEDVLGPFLLQLPAAFGPERLEHLWRFVDALPAPLTCTVEVRHSAFFGKGEAEKALNRGLRERNIARVCMDSRALFTAAPDSETTRDAQSKKPRVPVHLLPVEAPPVIRYVGHPDLEANRPFLTPWIERAAAWIEEGKRPYIFMHMPNKGDALSLAILWNELLRERVPTVDALCVNDTQPQMGLF
ncbi:DUF72 domain-containing protein [Marinobacter sp. 71-i]|uniref:DUF72 domain-containing protein n=1 Tax=Marinobacter iranensis TaxID=2962607 RepID=A0ABT5Y523_9GAMM|nr:DUF72 domain-containing protein [Marinobacter iranensis]MDF0748662.1 DUF72 domain-containing protein [Marinobacter iranensis]